VRLAWLAGVGLSLLAPPLAAQDDLGRKVFTEIAQPPCRLCHTLQAAGATATVGPSLDEVKPDKQRVLETVKTGIGPMPPFADKLTPEQIEAVANYVAEVAGQ
jgi:cytochrome c6